ncbi:hypothetical protein F66182_5444 [Fusarium sp. NRRL 66182]|nr:hypothetical protein F66182_5444 [Fusarium sp. NRRL 66182]
MAPVDQDRAAPVNVAANDPHPPEQSGHTISRGLCKICQDHDYEYSPEIFSILHGYDTIWPFECTTEEERYKNAHALMKRCLQENARKQAQVRLEAMGPDRSQLSKNQERVLSENVTAINRFRYMLKARAKRIRGKWLDDFSRVDLMILKPVRLTNPVLETGVGIFVARAEIIRGSRYYLGHPPGDFIFKYRDHRGIVTRQDFSFQGQVPRHPDHHVIRTREIFPRLLKMFIYTLDVKAGKDHQTRYPDFGSLASTKYVRSAKSFEGIHKLWVEEEKSSDWPNDYVRAHFVCQPDIWELAWLLNHLKIEKKSGDDQQPHELEHLLVSATGESLNSLEKRWAVRLEKEAWDKLESGNRKGLFVYECEPQTEDIHAYYKQPPFDSDPLNPRVFYQVPKIQALPAN